ncbi:MAG: hypothetical protein IKS55_09325 [Oscillospiraceae bacterium]|nr:hypothetical protein [Oscillospiraceae bacterium]
MKKILSIWIIAAMLVSLPGTAFAGKEGGFGGLLSNVQQSYQPVGQEEALPDGAPSAEQQLKEAAEGKDLTILIYMCGSNLESSPQSSASRDIREIVASDYDTEKINVLLMAGGSRKWHLEGIGGEKTGIYSVRPDGITKLWESGTSMNMGEPSTLSTLLRYGVKYFPAEEYAAILWDHGSGAIGGVCQDETTNDSLSLSELRTAMRNSPFAEEKLEWLGFDACLMASTEVAIMMAPFADYLIASEETEPGYGWNYSFLKGAEKDRDGAETGKRIVDSYFDWYEENGSSNNLTLSCIDLSEAEQLAEQTDRFFREVRQNAFPDRKNELSKAVRRAKAFGSVDENASADADNTNANVYDLLDLGDLVSCLQTDQIAEGEALLRFLKDEVVVYTRNNIDADLAGMTVYHPLRAKNHFLTNLSTYRGFGILPEYVSYIDEFGRMLLETPAASFSGLLASVQNSGKAQRVMFSLPLSETQRNNLEKAQLLVLQRAGEQENAYHLVSVSNDPYINRKGNLNGAFVFRNLFLTEEDGSMVSGSVPLGFTLNEDGQISVPVTLVTEDESGETETKAYLVGSEEEDGSLTVNSLLVYDELAQCYTTRSLVDLDTLKEIHFSCVDRAVTRNADGAILGFEDWNIVGKTEQVWRAEEPYSLRFLEDSLDEETLYAAFALTDLQSNRYTSELVRFTGENGPGTVQFRYTDRNRLLMLRNLFCDPVDEQGSVWLSIDVTNMTMNEVVVGLSKLTIDGFEVDGDTVVYGTGPNYGLLTDETQTLFVILDAEQLAGIRELRALRFQLTVTDAVTEEVLGTVLVRASVQVTLKS